MKYSILTFGCRVNQADSLAFEEELLSAGARGTAPEEADVVIVNTCSVTASADQGARQTIRRIARSNPAARIVVTGCYATRRPDEVGALPSVAAVVPNGRKHLVTREITLRPVAAEPTTAERYADGDGACGAAVEPGIAGRTAFTLRVQTGCAEPCSYCIIPLTRGEPQSLALDSVRREIDRIVAAGFKEVVLTGVHLGSYGRDLSPRSSLIELMRVIAGAGALFRIGSLEPMDCTLDIVRCVAEQDCFAPHFHLPLQHASNRTLAAMRRPYTIEQYASLVGAVRMAMPHASIGSDVIVGFPGEDDGDFGALSDYLAVSPLTHVHVFPYSDRPGTPASTLTGKVPGTVVRDRARELRDISSQLSRRFRTSQVGTTRRGLTLEDGSLVVTDNFLKLRIAPGHARNEWVQVHVLDGERGQVVS